MKALLIDHDDSFTYNLRNWLSPAFSVEVRNHRDLEVGSTANLSHFSIIVLSPGPKAPQDYGYVKNFIHNLNPEQKLFGICLGMQLMNECESGKVYPYSPPLHGKKSKLVVSNSALGSFAGLKVARYHSLQCEIPQSKFEILAMSDDDQKPMWIKHKSKNWLGFQFHPESFLTEKPEMFLGYLSHWCNQSSDHWCNQSNDQCNQSSDQWRNRP